MSRVLKRVPLDFKHPIGETWGGYINQHAGTCLDCEDSAGYSAAYKAIYKALTHQPVTEKEKQNSIFVQFLQNETKEELENRLKQPDYSYRKIIEIGQRLGLKENWIHCDVCEGLGVHPEEREAYNSWERTDPPEGPGYQLWETTSEGSPKSPVFETFDELCEWCEPNVGIFGSVMISKEEWKNALDSDQEYFIELT